MAKNKDQVVQPEVSRRKFDAEIAEFVQLESEWRRKGIFCLKVEFPIIQLIFLAHHLKPATVAFAVAIDFTNYDIEPPSVIFIDYLTGNPISTKEMGGIGFFQIITQMQQIQGPLGIQQIPIQQRLPILMIGLEDKPFLCIPGVREYHNHPAHTGNAWLLYRTRGEGKLSFLIEQLYSNCIPHITNFNFTFDVHLKQF